MKMDQIAFYAHDEAQAYDVMVELGLAGAKWVEDEVTGAVWVDGGKRMESKAHLRFNYDLGIELEILTYLQGPHWLMTKPDFKTGLPFLSHIGIHMEKNETPAHWKHADSRMSLRQVMSTLSHTNSYLVENGRTYHYEIYDLFGGQSIKFIWRREREASNG